MNNNFNAGLYIRLSKEDKNESIKNQKELLIYYAKNNNFNIKDIYIDDGFTGTNFNRPEFQRLLKDIEDQLINIVIVKDLSRLGRDYIKTGEYLEHYFPVHNVRFIAITDNIDTFLDNTNMDLLPFKTVLNDLYAKDLSKKIKTAIKTMQLNGLWTGGCIPLGYKKSAKYKNKLVINNKEANIVKLIYELFNNGNSINDIKTYLHQNKIPTFSRLRKNKNCLWQNSTIKKILTNRIYKGDLIQNKYKRLNYKYRKIIKNNPHEWIIKKNIIPKIIDEKLFDTTQFKIQYCSRFDKKEKKIFDNLLYCYECKHHLSIRYQKKYNKYYLCCNNYRYNKSNCTAHGFSYDILENDLLHVITQEFNLKNIDSIIVNTIITKIEISQNKNVFIFFK